MDVVKFLTKDEDSRLSALLDKDDSRDGLMLTLLRKYGMRPSELLAIRRSDVGDRAKELIVSGSKGSNPRQFPVPPKLARRIWKIAKDLDHDAPVFPISYNRLGEIWRFWRPCKKPLKSLRHTMAVEMYRKTLDIRFVQRTLGHKALSSTMIYQDFRFGVEDFARVMCPEWLEDFPDRRTGTAHLRP